MRCNELNIALAAIPVSIEIGSQVGSYRFGNSLSCDYSVYWLWAGVVKWRSPRVKLFVEIVSSAQEHLRAR